MSDQYIPWPYTAKAVIQHEFDTDHLNIWLTFKFKMNVLKKPADEVWLVEVDDVAKPISASVWQDTFTLLLTVPDVSSLPDRVLVEYDGPDELLITTWEKQWEPWGPILSMDITT